MTLLAFAIFLLGAADIENATNTTEAMPAETSAAADAGAPQQKNERLICRRVGSAATGSTLGHRRCLTAEQWREYNRRR